MSMPAVPGPFSYAIDAKAGNVTVELAGEGGKVLGSLTPALARRIAKGLMFSAAQADAQMPRLRTTR